MKKLKKSWKNTDQWHISAAILAWRRRPVASMIALDPLRRSMRLVTYRRTDRASKMAYKYCTFSYFFNGIQTRRLSGAIWPEYSTDGGVQWLHVKPWTPSIGRCWRFVPAHQLECRNGSDGGAFVCRRQSCDRLKRS
jgi:hypothetical protein